MPYSLPVAADFRSQFARDFPFAPDGVAPAGADLEKVYDADINSAFVAAKRNFNADLFSDQSTFSYCFLLLSAHYLVTTLRSSGQGINGQGEWFVQQKSAGSLSTTFAIPGRILKNPTLGLLAKTSYGAQYLELMLPTLIGNMTTVYGPTKP